MRKISVVFFAFAMLTLAKSFGQELPDVQNSFKEYTSNTLQEKLYVHTDKNGYTAGELLWFKVYNVDGIFMKPWFVFSSL